MSITPPIMPLGPIQPTAPVADAAAHRSAFDFPGMAGPAGADGSGAMGQLVLDTVNGFQARAGHVHAAVHGMLSSGGAPSAMAATASQPAAAAPAATVPGGFAMADQRAALGVMVEVFDFAIQSELVSRAATTFTSSVNTLVKTQ